MLRLTRKDAAAARRSARAARARRALITLLTLAFATFISVANATADELVVEPQQPTSEVVILVPAQPAPVVELAPKPDPAPIVEEKIVVPEPVVEKTPVPVEKTPVPVEVAKVEPVVEPVVIVDNSVQKQVVQEVQQPQSIQAAGSHTLVDFTCQDDSVQKKDENRDDKIDQADCDIAEAAKQARNFCGNGAKFCIISGTAPNYVLVDHKIDICHATGDVGKFTANNIDIASIIDSGNGQGDNDHGSHTKTWNGVTVTDIFKGFTYGADTDKDGVIDVVGTIAGRGLGAVAGSTGEAILANGCVVPTQIDPGGQPVCTPPLVDFAAAGAPLDCRPVEPTALDPIAVPVCHKNGDGTFSSVSWVISGGTLLGAGNHDPDVDDIFRGFRYHTGYTWNATDKTWDKQYASVGDRNLGAISTTITFPVVGALTFNLVGATLLDTGCGTPTVPAEPATIRRVPVQICHANNGSGSDFYNLITVDDDAILNNGHDGHQFDIIPSFEYVVGWEWDPTVGPNGAWVEDLATYAGKNLRTFQRTVHFPRTGDRILTIDGAAIGAKLATKTATAADCGPADPPTKPLVADRVVSVCHATTLAGFDTYVRQDWTIVGGNVAAGHGLDSNDIIGSIDDVIVDYVFDTDPAVYDWVPVYATPRDYPGQNLGTFTRSMTLPDVGTIQWTIDGADALASNTCEIDLPASKPRITATPVTLCHATTLAGFDTYVRFVGTSDDVIGAGTHGSDADDIIPAFTYTTGYTFDPVANAWNAVTRSHAGQNLGSFTRTMNLPLIGSVMRTLDGTQMLATNCQVPSLPARPDIDPVTVTMCHAYDLDGVDYYSNVSTGHTGVIGATGHDADANDVIPAFTYTTGYTYDHVTNAWIAQTASYAGKNLGTFTRTVNLASGPATLTFDGTAMLAAGTCPMPAVLGAADSPAPTPGPDATAGGDEPAEAAADPIEADAEVEAAEGAAEEPAGLAAIDDADALPFTGLELGALLLIGLGAIGAGSVLHGARRRRRVIVRD